MLDGGVCEEFVSNAEVDAIRTVMMAMQKSEWTVN